MNSPDRPPWYQEAMDSQLDAVDLKRALATLDWMVSELLEQADGFAAAAVDADRWGLRTEAEKAAEYGRRCRVEAVILRSRAAAIGERLSKKR